MNREVQLIVEREVQLIMEREVAHIFLHREYPNP
jgi:hypothetical protein